MENKTPAAKTITTRRCNCGCGEATSSAKTQYKPGHDARHASSIGKDLADFWKLNGEGVSHNMLDELGSDKLRAKAVSMAKRIVEKPEAKITKSAAKTPAKVQETSSESPQEVYGKTAAPAEEPMWTEYETGITARVGRWEYPGRRYFDSDINEWLYERNSKRDGSGEWLAAEYAQFK